MTASLNNRQYNSMAHGVSSLPGTGYVISRGSQLESKMPMLGMFNFAVSVTASWVSKILFSVETNTTISGSRVTAPNFDRELVKVPDRHTEQQAYSPHSTAVRSTSGIVCMCRLTNRTMPPRNATCARKFKASPRRGCVCSTSIMSMPIRVPNRKGTMCGSRTPTLWPRWTRLLNRSATVTRLRTLKKSWHFSGSTSATRNTHSLSPLK